MRRALVFGFLALSLHAELIDRLVIVVGRHVITELQLDEELRVTAFLNGIPVARSTDARRDAGDRLVEQLLIRREMEFSRYPMPDSRDVSTYMEQVVAGLNDPDHLGQTLKAYDLSEDVLREHLTLQLTTLRFIEYRFKSDLSVSDADVQTYYRRELAANGKMPRGTPPSFDSVKESIKQTLVDRRTDEALDNWLEEARKQVNIVYLDKTLQ